MRPCPTCNAPNPQDKTVCYACGQSLTSLPVHGQAPPAAQQYPQQPYPQQQYPPQPYPAPQYPQQYPQPQPPQPYAPQQYAPQQQYAPEGYPPQVPAPSMPPGYAPQQPYAPQPGMAPYAQPPYPQGYAQPPAPGMVPQQMAAAPYYDPAEAARAAKIKEDWGAITRQFMLAVLLAVGAGAVIIFAFKDQQTILGIPRLYWGCAPILGMVAFGFARCRCPGCKASLMTRSDVNETGECPFCGAQLK